MFVNYRTQGFILKKSDRGEADQLLTVFTKDFGKLEILAKAVRKVSSKLKSGTDFFYLSEIEFIQGKIYKTLTDAVLIEKFENVRKDLVRLKIAHKIAEVFDNLVRGQEKDENLWQLLIETFENLNHCQIVRSLTCQSLYYYFFWNLLSLLGYQPDFYHCVLCQRRLVPEKNYFSPREGGIICQKHAKDLKLGKAIDLATLKILRIIIEKNWHLLAKLKIKKDNLKSLEEITSDFYSYIKRLTIE